MSGSYGNQFGHCHNSLKTRLSDEGLLTQYRISFFYRMALKACLYTDESLCDIVCVRKAKVI